jgi:hypothetical protein
MGLHPWPPRIKLISCPPISTTFAATSNSSQTKLCWKPTRTTSPKSPASATPKKSSAAGYSPEAAEAATENPDAPAAPEADEPITLATYTVYDEANLARGLLQSAGIPCALKSAQATLGVYEILLIVPASMEQDALEVLASDISDEDLAAQAEAEEI